MEMMSNITDEEEYGGSHAIHSEIEAKPSPSLHIKYKIYLRHHLHL
jgi:hypothetical protein